MTTQAKPTTKKSMLGFLETIGIVETVPDKPAAHDPDVSSSAPPLPRSALHHAVAGADPQVIAKLEAKLQAAAPPIYIAFMEQFTTLADVIADEGTRIKAALKTSKCSIPQLLEALGQLGDAMTHAKDDFEASFEHNKTEHLGQAQQSIAATDDLIKSREAQIKALQDEVVSLHAKRDNSAQQMQVEADRLEGIHESFLAAHAQVTERLGAQKNRIASMGV